MQVESSATPLLTEDKASSLPGKFRPFHPPLNVVIGGKSARILLCVLP